MCQTQHYLLLPISRAYLGRLNRGAILALIHFLWTKWQLPMTFLFPYFLYATSRFVFIHFLCFVNLGLIYKWYELPRVLNRTTSWRAVRTTGWPLLWIKWIQCVRVLKAWETMHLCSCVFQSIKHDVFRSHLMLNLSELPW